MFRTGASASLALILWLQCASIVEFVHSFVLLPNYYTFTSSESSLFGIRSSLRQKIPFLRKGQVNYRSKAERRTVISEEMEVENLISRPSEELCEIASSTSSHSPRQPTSNHLSIQNSPSYESEISLIGDIMEELPNGTISLLNPKVMRPAKPLYTLVSVDGRELTKYEEEFREMLSYFSGLYSRDLQVLDPRTRTLFEGVAASANDYPVYRAFEVLYQDILPLRVAGRVIFERLQGILGRALRDRDVQVHAAVEHTGLDQDTIKDAWYRFVGVSLQLNGKPYLTKNQLANSTLASICTNVIGNDVDDLLCYFLNEHVDFTALVNGLQNCVEELCCIEQCNPTAVLFHVTEELEKLESKEEAPKLSARKISYSAKYDRMVEAFIGWKDRIPDIDNANDTSRRLDVVRGCFVGAENEKVVNALRIVYVDYSALRMAGDLIFGIVSSIMGKIKPKGGTRVVP